MPFPLLRLLTFVIAGLAPAAALACNALEPSALSYRIERGDTTLGAGTIALEAAGRPGCYLYSQTAKPKLWLRWLSGKIEEESRFCIDQGAFRSQAYRYERKGMGADKENYELAFDWTAGVVSGGRFGRAKLPAGASDQMLLRLRVRDWICRMTTAGENPMQAEIETPFVDRKGPDSYRFAVVAQEEVETPAGRFWTVRVDRVDPSSRMTQFWLAPKLDYQVVKAEQRKRDDPPIRLLLLELPAPAAAPQG